MGRIRQNRIGVQLSEKSFLEGDDLEPYKVTRSGECWWCGAVATTSEHKFKHADLRRLNGDGSGLLWGDGERVVRIRSLRKSKQVRFGPNLCAECNNARSQSFDMAYDKFVAYLWASNGRLGNSRHIDMKQVYGETWRGDVIDLARYVVKHIGCRMDDDGYAVPSGFSAFLEGGSLLPNVQMVTFKDPVLWDIHKRLHEDRSDWSLGLWIDPARGAISRSRKMLTMYSSSLTIGYVGIMYRWDLDVEKTDPFYLYRKARLHRRDRLPEV